MPKYRERGTARFETGPVEAETAAKASRALTELTPRLGENEYSYLEKWDEESQDWLPADELDDEEDDYTFGMTDEEFAAAVKKADEEASNGPLQRGEDRT